MVFWAFTKDQIQLPAKMLFFKPKIVSFPQFYIFLAGSNSNLFVFKNGWSSGTQGVQKSRPQSSNQNAYKRKPLAPASANRIWKYNQAPTMSTTGFARTSSTHKLQETQQNFLTNSTKPGGDFLSQRISTNPDSHKPKVMDKSIKGVLSGSTNLVNLTQSAVARQNREP
jgi:hypothetical protein